MHDEVEGHNQPPDAWLERTFGDIATTMRELPFFRPDVPLRACGFTLFERQWVGCLLTPWMQGLLVLPGPVQVWPRRAVGERLALRLPCGDVGFRVNEIDDGAQYLGRSLMSPLAGDIAGESAVRLAEHSARLALSLPVVDGDAPPNAGRRALFGRVGSHGHA